MKKIAIGLALAVLGLAIGLAVALPRLTGGADKSGRYALTVARDMPDDTPVFMAVPSPAEVQRTLLRVVGEERVEQVFQQLVDGDTDSDPEGPRELLQRMGIDATAPMGVGALYRDGAQVTVVSAGVTGPDAATELAAYATEQGLWDEDEIQDADFGEVQGLWLTARLAIAVRGDRLIGVYVDGWRVEPAEIHELVAEVMTLAPDDSLAAVDGLDEVVDVGGRATVLWVVVPGVIHAEWLDELDLQRLPDPLEEVVGAAVGLELADEEIVLRSALVAESTDAEILLALDGPPRDTRIYRDIPGPAVAGAHYSLDPEATWELVEEMLEATPDAREDLAEFEEEFDDELGFGIDDVIDALTGEYGAVLLDWPRDESMVGAEFLLFYGVDPEQAEDLLDDLVDVLEAGGVDIDEDEFDGTEMITVDTGRYGPDIGLAVHEEALWISIDDDALKKLLRGVERSVRSASPEVADALSEPGVGAFAVHLGSAVSEFDELTEDLDGDLGRQLGEHIGMLQGAVQVSGVRVEGEVRLALDARSLADALLEPFVRMGHVQDFEVRGDAGVYIDNELE